MEKKSSKGIVIVILVLALVGLGGYFVYDKFMVEDNTSELQKQVKSLNREIETLKSSKSTTIKKQNTSGLIGAYSGKVDAPAEIGKPSEIDELLIKDEENAVFCFNVGTSTSCYKGTYIVNDNELFLHSTEKQILDGSNIVENGSDNSYMTFIIGTDKITYNGEAHGSSLNDNLSKTEISNLKYINSMK